MGRSALPCPTSGRDDPWQFAEAPGHLGCTVAAESPRFGPARPSEETARDTLRTRRRAGLPLPLRVGSGEPVVPPQRGVVVRWGPWRRPSSSASDSEREPLWGDRTTCSRPPSPFSAGAAPPLCGVAEARSPEGAELISDRWRERQPTNANAPGPGRLRRLQA